MSAYLLDSGVFIEAKNRQYPFDVFPSYWKCIESHAALGRLVLS